jgi:hypothetical protein
VFPVSPWTLRAPDQVVRYLRPSVWLVLGGRTCVVSCEKLVCSKRNLKHGCFSNGLFLKKRLKKPVPRMSENQIISGSGGERVK